MKNKVNDKRIFYTTCKMKQNRQEDQVCRYLEVDDFLYRREIYIFTMIAVLVIGQQKKNTEIIEKKYCTDNIKRFLLQGDIKEITRTGYVTKTWW